VVVGVMPQHPHSIMALWHHGIMVIRSAIEQVVIYEKIKIKIE
jgi:hypothetical protein